jgi:hypothetical protein
LKFAGRAEGVEDLSHLLKAKVNATVELGELLRADVAAPSLNPFSASVRASGTADVSPFLPILPAQVASRLPASPAGRVQISLSASYSEGAITISELNLRATDVRLNA